MSTSLQSSLLTIEPLLIPKNCSHIDLFSTFANQPWSFWLDSCDSVHVDSRYDIMVWQPEVTITTHGSETKITAINNDYKSLETISTDDPLTLLKQTQATVLKHYTPKESHLPFSGGSVGYFAYDLGRRFEKLPRKKEKNINAPEMAVGIYCHALVFDRQLNELHLVCPQQQRLALTASLLQQVQRKSELLDPELSKDSNAFALTSPWQANMDKQSYQAKFAQVQDYLLSGDCYQINLAQRFEASYQGDEFSAYLKLRECNQAPFSAFMRFDDYSILSISPERFLQLHGAKVQSKPIKGTLPRAANKVEDKALADQLLHSTKDRAENLMIVDLLRNDISRVCKPGSVKVPKLFDIESFPAVHHLVSTVEGELDSKFEATDLLRASFPGGSITGAPKIRAMEVIDELEPHCRSVYCGSIGYISACGNMDTSITIRTLLCEDHKIYCWAGGGLVADSIAENEYQETFDKVRKILPILSEQA